MELHYTNRVLSAREAMEWGLVTRVRADAEFPGGGRRARPRAGPGADAGVRRGQAALPPVDVGEPRDADGAGGPGHRRRRPHRGLPRRRHRVRRRSRRRRSTDGDRGERVSWVTEDVMKPRLYYRRAIVLRQDEGAPHVWGIEFDPVDIQADPSGRRGPQAPRHSARPGRLRRRSRGARLEPAGYAQLLNIPYSEKHAAAAPGAGPAGRSLARPNPDRCWMARLDAASLDIVPPERKRSIRDLGFHIFRVGLSFVDTMDLGSSRTPGSTSARRTDLGRAGDVARWGALVRGRIAGWFEGAGDDEFERVLRSTTAPRAPTICSSARRGTAGPASAPALRPRRTARHHAAGAAADRRLQGTADARRALVTSSLSSTL